jgi:hypothetical protein
MAKKKNPKFKFSFGTDFQEQILQYIVTDKKGYKALNLLDDGYFTYIPHAIVCFALKKYFKKSKRIPELPYLRESLRTLYENGYKALANITDEDKAQVAEVLDKIFSRHVSDDSAILEKVTNFAKYVKFREEIENVDINNYESYEKKIQSFQAITNIGKELTENYGTFLIQGMTDRAFRRNLEKDVTPTPFRQLNKTLNSGGTNRGSLITIIAEEKRFKTGMLINIAKGYLKQKKKGVYFDFENGEEAITVRNEQSFAGLHRADIISEKFDKKLMKLFRKYKRLGAELYIKRFPALITNTDHLQAELDRLKADFGFVPDFAIADYGFLLASKSGKTDDFGRISDSFLDLKNFAAHNNLDALWTVAHVVREAVKRRGTKYKPGDIAKCIDIPRHIDMLMGLQESDEEKEAGVMRLEVIEQRDGIEGRVLFWADLAKQSLKEFTESEVREYHSQLSGEEPEEEPKKRKRKTDI